MTSRIHILIRRTIDWADPQAAAREIIADMRPKCAVWNDTFTLSYPLFRDRLKKISLANFARVHDAVVAEAADIPQGAIIVPVDDDDWFSPDLAVELRENWPADIDAVHWQSHALEAKSGVRWQRLLHRLGLGRAPGASDGRYLCTTNNYAVRNIDPWQTATLGHGKASRLFTAHLDRTHHLPRRLSIQNRNLSSQTALNWGKPTISRATLLRRYHRWRKLYRENVLPEDLQWAKPEVRQMAELMRELRLK